MNFLSVKIILMSFFIWEYFYPWNIKIFFNNILKKKKKYEDKIGKQVKHILAETEYSSNTNFYVILPSGYENEELTNTSYE
ncbi:hypothetical protein PFAG_04254 [Plasmodium falciparum Santa Lucia]|uniref:Uncharacterized protein n=10 Tax=Plasmodium falciparum TaxID=5833 RepID=A0A5K1K810_PLAF7|nr:uncharacterized protein PF3D7_1302050 [Plasmodium falciparum 3D7]ETW17027.1 hypothetical protein PFFVO_03856 [Plasmodium falciparum Vietnam Oak-Knoll (FVO)]ETW35058.1 hypothetical protein PFTANZ_04226 [Plasmodium falciparum Tanzania (2000708)]ETW47850.1 hypothetical protein PFMALIP_04107 [Plasmodium falciparum MaliPS096_E11]ETW54883.1 hypothetical protein PFUGPA_03485 [Plasmodium falciparum Palo Alto/Uganda]ETW59759.1 hypothetical protein PFMC_04221 [Plasmodium falciparum CAMP/Malaysia]EUR